jgi:hypothetical protein
MFKKPHDVSISSSSLLRNKDGRAIRDAASKQLNIASGDELDYLLPNKGIAMTKFAANRVVAYGDAADKVPMLIDLDPKAGIGRLLPTVFALWRVPTLLPTLLIHAPVSQFLVGARV